MKADPVIRAFEEYDKSGCLTAFKSNVPLFFTVQEVDEFESFLDNFKSQIINGKYFEKTYYYVIVVADKVIGCGGFGYNNKTNTATLAWGLVHRDFHKKGYGKKLLMYRLEQIKKLYTKVPVVIDTTQFSSPFFKKFGFSTTKITRDFYAVGMHRYDMILKDK